MTIPSQDEFRRSKDPRYNAKTTIAVTERVLGNWCARSDAYLWVVQNCQGQAIRREQEVKRTGKMDGRPVFRLEAGYPFEVVSYDNLEYGLEMTLKAAQMVDGYHGLNRDLGIPGFIENFDVSGFTYVYVRPTHRLDTIYNDYLSDAMKGALRSFLPMKECLDQIYGALHSDMLDVNWAPGSNYSAGAGRVRYDSKRYTSDWVMARLNPGFVLAMLEPLRQLNKAIPAWFHDRELKARRP